MTDQKRRGGRSRCGPGSFSVTQTGAKEVSGNNKSDGLGEVSEQEEEGLGNIAHGLAGKERGTSLEGSTQSKVHLGRSG